MSYIQRGDMVHYEFFYLYEQARNIDPSLRLNPGDPVTEKWFNRMLQALGLSLRVSAGQNLTEMSRLSVEELNGRRNHGGNRFTFKGTIMDTQIFKFPVLHEAWECDSDAWVMERPDGTRYLRMTNHGAAYEASLDDLRKRIAVYESVIAQSRKAIELMTPTQGRETTI